MSNLFFNKKIILLLILLSCAFLGMGQEKGELFNEKWKIAQTYLAEGQMEPLLVVVKEMEALSQENKSSQQGKIAYLLGEYWYEKEGWLKANLYLETAINYLKSDTVDQLVLAESYLVKGYCLHELEEYDKVLPNYEEALSLKQKIYGPHHLKVVSIYFNIGYIYQEKFDFQQSDLTFLKGIESLKVMYPKENVHFADFYEELGFNKFSKNDFDGAVKYLEKAISLKEETLGKYEAELVYPYKYLGINFRNFEHFGESIDYFNKALQIVEKQQERDVFQEAMLHFHIGTSYLNLKNYKQAFAYFDKAIAIDKSNPYLLPEVHRFRGNVESEKGNTNAAAIHFEIAIKGFKEMKQGEKYLTDTYKSMMDHHILNANYNKALVYGDKAIEIGRVIHENREYEFFDIYLSKGKCYRQLNDSLNWMFYYKKAKEANGGNIEWAQANLKQLKNRVSLNIEYASSLYKDKGGFGSGRDLSNLLKTDTLLSNTIELVDYINKNYQERSTKENFIEEYHHLYREAIKVKYLLHSITKDTTYLKEAFTLSEKSKNLILLETLKNISAFQLAGIPDSLVETEKQLRTDITYLENRRFEAQQESVLDRKEVRELNGNIFELKQAHHQLLNQIELDYPEYYQLKFAPIELTIQAVQEEIITKDQSILEYFIGQSNIYVFLIKKKSFQVFTLPKQTDLETKINQFRESIYSYRPSATISNKVESTSFLNITNRLGGELYQILVQPFQHELTRKVTIIADGALGYIPFDALITHLPEENNGLSSPDYLMAKHQISYGYSANWLSSLSNKKEAVFDQNFVGIAPVFKSNGTVGDVADFRLGLGPLKYNQEEVTTIKKSIGGKVITGEMATRQAFLAHIQKGQVLHLATHGKSNDEQGDYSYLAFAEPQENTDNQFLYVKDLFNLNIPAELVVLSACETGLGEIKRGEGIVGIGKGFSYAGTKSMVTTLWRVSDNSTANFMPLFYKNLKAGLPKDEALWTAKNEFIQTYRSAAHPFFWSGYVAYGNMEPILFQHNNLSLPLIIGGILLVLCLSIFSYSLTKQKAI